MIGARDGRRRKSSYSEAGPETWDETTTQPIKKIGEKTTMVPGVRYRRDHHWPKIKVNV